MHIPKTGGTYIRKILDLLSIKGIEKAQHHDSFPELLNILSLKDLSGITVICFIRHPLTWYQSRWAYRLSSVQGWQGHDLDFFCASNDFNIFVNNCIDYSGGELGWASKKMNKFINNIPNGLKTIIGKQENLHNDLISALIRCGAIIPETDLPLSPRLNMSLNDKKPAHIIAKYDQNTYKRVLKADGEFIERFYKDTVIDHNVLF